MLDEVDFLLAERAPVQAEDVVEPDRRLLATRHRVPPLKDGVGFAADQPPVDGPDVVLFEIGRESSKVLPSGRAMYSVQMMGR